MAAGRRGRCHHQMIAVLPLRDVSPDPKEAWFAEGMTDALIADLSAHSPPCGSYRGSRRLVFQDSRESMMPSATRIGRKH